MQINCQSMYAPIQSLLLKHPREAFRSQARIDGEWQGLNYTAAPDFEEACREYDRFLALLSSFGLSTRFLPPDDRTTLDSLYARDPLILTHRGAVIGNMGKAARRAETAAIAAFLKYEGITILGEIGSDGRLEGGDVVWLDDRTLAVGEGYRTNASGIDQLRTILGDEIDAIIPVPLPHWNGPDDVLHLMSMLSPVDADLCVVYPRLMPVPFLQSLVERGIALIEVPDDEFETMGCNVLAVAPGQCVMVAENPKTRRLLERAGCAVYTYSGIEISLKGGGGPTCLTQPLLRT